MKRTLGLLGLLATTATVCLTGCKGSKRVVIWTSGEDYKNAFYLEEIKKQFPNVEFDMQYVETATIAAKVLNEGERCEADIILSEEYGYLEKISDNLETQSDFDYSVYLDEIVPASKKYTPELKNGGCIILDPAKLQAKGLPEPTSYADLLDSKYKNLVTMPNPKKSGTGYMFLRQLTNEWGEQEAFNYFDSLFKNGCLANGGGSSPINNIKSGECAIGLGMISQAAQEITNGQNFKIVFFEEGAPYSMYGNAIVKGHAGKENVKDVFNYLATTLCKADNEKYFPDQIFKDFVPETVPNFPKNVKYGNMSNDTLAEKERLLEKWTFTL